MVVTGGVRLAQRNVGSRLVEFDRQWAERIHRSVEGFEGRATWARSPGA